SRRRHTRWPRDWSSDVCSSDLRVTFLVRIGLYSEGDFAEYRDGVIQVVSVNKGRAVILDLHTHRKDRAEESEMKRLGGPDALQRSEERRVGKEWKSGRAPYQYE